MAYDDELAESIREALSGVKGVTERRMFGGLAFLINGNMAVAASRNGGMLVRVNPAEGDALVDDKHIRPMVMRGREMRGWLYADVTAESHDLKEWVTRGVSFARSLPAKS